MSPSAVLFRSPEITVADWQCPGHDTPAGSEEWFDGYEVTIPRAGAYHRASGRDAVMADPGTAVFYSPVRGFRVRHLAGVGDCCTCIRVSEAGLRSLLQSYAPRRADRAALDFPASHVEVDGSSYWLQAQVLQSASTGDDALLTVELAIGFLNRAVALAAQRQGLRPNPLPRSNAIEYAHRVREVVARRFQEPLTLETIARAVHCSPFHLSRLFRSATGRSIHQFLVQIRARHALNWVRDTRHHLSRIALEAGFATHSHFTEAFRREFGVVPSVVRSGRSPLRQRTTTTS
jgi:AraC family transcriptional regulator